ncbi:class I SAM-dependent methyltransferase [Tersicoccus sp. MR15.9]|uniref:class I SAM-dependent methyltransferase n=1 Tax=Tersicoccus mangrovi TaxID=3121635 RepID=UPI002FE674BC
MHSRPVGTITRGTTGHNRLRRVDRWLAATHGHRLRAASDPLVVDLGYGAHPATAVELFARLRNVAPRTELVGLEIDPARVHRALPLRRDGLDFKLGGFELPLPGRRPVVVRAFNVLRQYPVEEVPAHWELLRSRLSPGGIAVDGTCDELGRRAAWITLDGHGPQSLTLSVKFATLDRPSDVAERLPKALIHRNVPGEHVHRFLQAFDRAWAEAASVAPFGRRQRFLRACTAMQQSGWPLLDSPSRWRLGEVTVAWSAVAPGSADRRPDHQGP